MSDDAINPPAPPAPEPRLSAETEAWLATINKNMKRMYEDEAYRLEVAKNLS